MAEIQYALNFKAAKSGSSPMWCFENYRKLLQRRPTPGTGKIASIGFLNLKEAEIQTELVFFYTVSHLLVLFHERIMAVLEHNEPFLGLECRQMLILPPSTADPNINMKPLTHSLGNKLELHGTYSVILVSA